jgi:hypothetical protein
MGVALRQAAQLFRRARAFPLRVIATALVLAAVVVGIELVKEHAFSPRFVLRALEADRDARTAPRMKRQLREYVMGAAFSNQALSELMRKHQLYPGIARNNPQAALESFREDIVVEVYRNYFVEERSAQTAPRSARISVSYRSEQRDVALAVTRDLGELVIAFERAARQKQADVAAARAKTSLDRARERYLGQTKKINEAAVLAGESGPDRELARVRGANLSRSLEGLERDLELAAARSAVLELGKDLEDQGLGLSFETVDRGDIPRSAELETDDLLLLGALTFLFGFPLAALAVGAFSAPIVNTQDLRNLDLPLLVEVRGLKLKARRGA